MESDPDDYLARGNPGGPRLDSMWEKLAPQLVVAPVPRRRRLLTQGWMGAVPLTVAAAAAWMLWVRVPAPAPGFAARGSATAMAPSLEATCGMPQVPPCPVGKPVLLRIHNAPPTGSLHVLLAQDNHVVTVAGPLEPKSDPPVAVPAAVTPQSADVATGVALIVVWLPDGATASAPDGILHTPGARVGRLTLAVSP